MIVDNSILDDIKKYIGLSEDDESFDQDVIMHINSAFERLHDLGVGPDKIFEIEDSDKTWGDFFGENPVHPRVCSFIKNCVKKDFDTPTGGVLDALERQINKDEWLLECFRDKTT